MVALSSPLKGEIFKKAGAHFEPLRVIAQDAPNMTVQISSGGYWVNNTTYVEFSGGTSPLITAPGSLAKWVFVTLKTDSTIELLDGAIAASPEQPVIPQDDRIILAGIFVNTGTTGITPGMISDLRPLFSIGTRQINVSELAGTSDPDLFPITSIINLQSELDNRYEKLTVDNFLANKADSTGTDELTFTFNQDEVGTPSSDVSIIVERGTEANVSIRWNESSEIWEFTNDGSIFEPLAPTEAAFDEMAQDAIGASIGAGVQTNITVTYQDTTDSIDFTVDRNDFHPDYELQTGDGTAVYTTAFTFTAPAGGKKAVLIFVNGVKQVPGASKSFVATAPNTITFNVGSEPAVGDDVEFYGFG